jgi:NAD(P)-dependent dehydrogenase (short-subunit alcohol dehydrogenase family)
VGGVTEADAPAPEPIPGPVDLSLEGQHALVTGAGRGIGRACALALVRHGASVTLVARSTEQLEAVAAEVRGIGGQAFLAPGDVRSGDDVGRVVGQAAGHGDLSIAVNAAGPTIEITDKAYDLVMDTNVRGTFLVCREAGRHLLVRGRGGRIVNISSQMGHVSHPGRAVYSASKHAVEGLTKGLAVEWAPHQITVNSVAPTFIVTPMTAPMFANAEFLADVVRRIPLGRVGTVAEVAAAVVFLASPAASLTTGTSLLVDGGWTAW